MIKVMERGILDDALMGKNVKFTPYGSSSRDKKEGKIFAITVSDCGGHLYFHIIYDNIEIAVRRETEFTLVKPLEDNTED